ncbi:hypothetical protein ACC687_38695, partial [Rhizobium ruizarguesonis]
PVNALDLALRKDFGKYQHEIDDLVLADFKVRILNGGTEAITRVLIGPSESATDISVWPSMVILTTASETIFTRPRLSKRRSIITRKPSMV